MSTTETAAILERFRREPGPFALATLVDVQGSSYRRAGARLLLTADGRRVGSISGGCLEEDVQERAQAVLATGRPETIVYDTTDENDLVWGVGLGCQGVVTVFVERLARMPDWAARLESNLRSSQPTALLVAWDAAHGSSRGTRLAEPGGFAGVPGVFRQVIEPPVTLAICGAGDDAQPLVRMAAAMGWNVLVADSRPAYPTPERFPEAKECFSGSPEDLVRRLPSGRHVAVVIMTHHYRHDVPLLRLLWPRPGFYLGLLGSRRRTEKILEDVEKAGTTVTPDMRARLRAPIGLDLGSDHPEDVALSIVAEIRTVLSGRDGRPLRERAQPIHA